MGGLLKLVFKPIVHPLARLLAGLIAIPLFRLVRRRIIRLQEWDEELEKDIDEWFRAALLLLLATANVEAWIDSWLFEKFNLNITEWWVAAGRLLLAVGVIEAMPDQALFTIIHPGPPRPRYDRSLGVWGSIRQQWWPIVRGLLCLHLNRSSPVLVIMSAIFVGTVGWVCYGMAIAQYLIIGLVTSRDRALDVLSEFDRQVARRREQLIEEFHIDPSLSSAPIEPAHRAGTHSCRPAT
jgi:hypothetical protein